MDQTKIFSYLQTNTNYIPFTLRQCNCHPVSYSNKNMSQYKLKEKSAKDDDEYSNMRIIILRHLQA